MLKSGAEMTKPNCYNCKYRRAIPGDAHSRCEHPSIKPSDSVFAPLLQLSGCMNDGALAELNISANSHGIRNGWFLWPINFDPTWLENCDGFEDKTTNNGGYENEKSNGD